MKEVLVVLVTCNNKNTSNFWKVGFGKLELLNFCYQLQQCHCVFLEVPLNTLIHKSGFMRIKSQFSRDDVCSEPVPSTSVPILECTGENQNNSDCSLYIWFHFQPVLTMYAYKMAIYAFCYWNWKWNGSPCGVLRFINYQQLLIHCFVLHVWICHCLLSIFCPTLLCVTPSSNSMSNRVTLYNWVRKLLIPVSGVCVFPQSLLVPHTH